MNEQRHALIRIEDAIGRRPWCTCGAPMDIAVDADGIWLTCSTLTSARPTGRVRRFLHDLTSGTHIREHLLDPVPARRIAA